MSRTLTCYLIGGQDGWEAICVDFDLAVQGRTSTDAFEILKGAIASYVEDAMQEEPAQRDRLLRRRSPWHVRTALALRFVAHWFLSDDDKGVQSGIRLPSPA